MQVTLQVTSRFHNSTQQQHQQQQHLKPAVAPSRPQQQQKEAQQNGPAKPQRPQQTGNLPRTVQDLEGVIAANCPVFYFHPEERCFLSRAPCMLRADAALLCLCMGAHSGGIHMRMEAEREGWLLKQNHARRYFPCTVQWFLERCELQIIRRGWRRRVIKVVERAGGLTGASLRAAQAWFGGDSDKRWRRHLLMLRLVDPAHRVGQPGKLNQARRSLSIFSM